MPVLLVHGRYDRMVPFEVSITILNQIAEKHLVLLNNCGYGPPFAKPAERAVSEMTLVSRKIKAPAPD